MKSGENQLGVIKSFMRHCALKGLRAGLSWETILKKRTNYYLALDGLLIEKMAKMSEESILKRMSNPGLIRNKLKLLSLKKMQWVLKVFKKNLEVFQLSMEVYQQ